MKRETYKERLAEVLDYHTGDLETAINLIGMVRDEYFSPDARTLSYDDRSALMKRVEDHYTDIQAALTAASQLLFGLATDLDAADGINTASTVIHKSYLSKVYGLVDPERAE